MPQHEENGVQGRPGEHHQLDDLLQFVRHDYWLADVLELSPEGPKFTQLSIIYPLVELMGVGRAPG